MPEIIVGATISKDHQPPEGKKEDGTTTSPFHSRVRQTFGCQDTPPKPFHDSNHYEGALLR